MSFKFLISFLQILLNAGLLRRCDPGSGKVGLLRTEDELTPTTLEKLNAVKSEVPEFELLWSNINRPAPLRYYDGG